MSLPPWPEIESAELLPVLVVGAPLRHLHRIADILPRRQIISDHLYSLGQKNGSKRAANQAKPAQGPKLKAAAKPAVKSQQLISRFLEMTASVPASDWMTVDRDKMSGTVNRVPVREEINPIANEQLVVELYSR